MGLALDDEIFNADSYRLNIPSLDGHKAPRLDIRFSGSGPLDRTSEDDLALLEAMRIGAPVGMIVTGEISRKGLQARHRRRRGVQLFGTCPEASGVESSA